MTISDPCQLLAPSQVQLLQQQVATSYSFGAFTSLDNILTILNVPVKIEPGIKQRTTPGWLEEEMRKCREEINRLQKDEHARKEDLEALFIKKDVIVATLNNYCSMSLLGEYVPSDSLIILYPEAMYAQEKGLNLDEYLISTLVHEIMHAYFNRPGHEQFPYAMLVEEPLAELGMLLFLYETKSSYYRWAYNNVKGKRTCYGQGAVLMAQYLSGLKSLKEYLEDYKIHLPKNFIPNVNFVTPHIISPAPKTSAVSIRKSFPYPLKDDFSTRWAVACSHGRVNIQCHKVVLVEKEFKTMAAEILRIIKPLGFENNIKINPDQSASYLDQNCSIPYIFDTDLHPHRKCIKESVCGVYPYYKHAWSKPMEIYGALIQAASSLLGCDLILVREDKQFVLRAR